MPRPISILICFLICILGCFLFAPVYSQGTSEIPKLIVFHSISCHKCIEAKKDVIPFIENEFRGRIEIEYRDTADMENYKLLLSLKEKHKSDIAISLPVFYLNGNFFTAGALDKNGLKSFILDVLGKQEAVRELKKVDLISRFNTFSPFVIIGAGLIDGINPCAFTVIVFFISFLALQGYKKMELSVIGLSFIFSVFLTYLLLGLGVFAFLYRLEGFWLVSKVINFLIGIFSVVLGVLAFYDFFKFKKTKQTEGLLLQLPSSIKNQIHRIIGLHYRNTKNQESQKQRRNILGLLFSALITGFLVSILEAVCTGQTYLPTITFVLKTSGLKLHAWAYLLLYNFMFIVPLLAIFFFALLGVTSEQFSNFLKRRLLTVKILMGTLFFGLGIFLIWKA
ncbi:MAG: hypothetical protein PHT41_05960 [Candidatus Omnitrophica bacterium]|nr:hypothetical protein [Candidatus Omnitrophota bacterium]